MEQIPRRYQCQVLIDLRSTVRMSVIRTPRSTENCMSFVTVSSDSNSLFKSKPRCTLFTLSLHPSRQRLQKFLQNVIEEAAGGV